MLLYKISETRGGGRGGRWEKKRVWKSCQQLLTGKEVEVEVGEGGRPK